MKDKTILIVILVIMIMCFLAEIAKEELGYIRYVGHRDGFNDALESVVSGCNTDHTAKDKGIEIYTSSDSFVKNKPDAIIKCVPNIN